MPVSNLLLQYEKEDCYAVTFLRSFCLSNSLIKKKPRKYVKPKYMHMREPARKPRYLNRHSLKALHMCVLEEKGLLSITIYVQSLYYSIQDFARTRVVLHNR